MSFVTTGFSKPYVAKYTNTAGTNTYTGGMLLGRGVSNELEVEAADDNNFYADNTIAETESTQFVSGSGTATIDGLDRDSAALVLGLPETEQMQIGSDSQTVNIQHYNDEMNAPYVGYAYIRRVMSKGVTSYIPVIHPKVKFGFPSDSAATQEDQIDWQTQELSFTVHRDDTEKHDWKLDTEPLATEALAESVIKKYFSIT